MAEQKIPPFVRRFAKVPVALGVLAEHERPFEINELARLVDADPEALRTDLHLFLDAHSGLYDQVALEFFVEDDREYVEVTTTLAAQELGVDYMAVADMADMYVAGQDLLELEPGNEVLRRALAKLSRVLVPPEMDDSSPVGDAGHVSTLRQAIAKRRRVRIEYSKAWRPGVDTRVVEPYGLLRTQRGWELDAGPVQRDRHIRTFLVSNIRGLEVLDESFDLPSNAAALREENRRRSDAILRLPPRSDWVVERFAEDSQLLEDDDGWKTIRVWVVEPVHTRIGLMVLIAGLGAAVVGPAYRWDADAELGRRLARRYRAGTPGLVPDG